MDLILLTVVLLICSLMFGFALYHVIMKVKDLNVQPLIFVAVVLGIIEVMIISLTILFALKIAGIIG